MGMYDYVNFLYPCPTCGKEIGTGISKFQTKEGDCCLATLDYLQVGNFYGLCLSCKTWVEFTRKPATSIDDYDMKVERHKKGGVYDGKETY